MVIRQVFANWYSKSLPPSSLSIVYSVPVDLVLERIRILILNAILLNVLVGAGLFTLARMYERRIFIPAESDAQRLEEHEQFNRKSSPPRRWGSVFCALLMVSIF